MLKNPNPAAESLLKFPQTNPVKIVSLHFPFRQFKTKNIYFTLYNKPNSVNYIQYEQRQEGDKKD